MSSDQTQIPTGSVTIRRLDEKDVDAIERLAALDSTPAPEGALLGAEVEGRLLAAISLADGAVIADPFSRTGELRSLLELRAEQVRRRNGRRRRGLHLTGPHGRSHAGLASSPPGAGGRLLTLLPRH